MIYTEAVIILEKAVYLCEATQKQWGHIVEKEKSSKKMNISKISIDPYKGAGPIRFGMAVEQVRDVIGYEITRFVPSSVGVKVIPEDDAHEARITVLYTDLSDSAKCIAIHFYGDQDKSTSKSNPIFLGKSILRMKFEDVVKLIQKHDPSAKVEWTGLPPTVEEVEASIVSKKYGLSVWTEHGKWTDVVTVVSKNKKAIKEYIS